MEQVSSRILPKTEGTVTFIKPETIAKSQAKEKLVMTGSKGPLPGSNKGGFCDYMVGVNLG